MQEIFIKAYKAIDHFRKESSFYTWLYKIAINTAKTYLIDKNRHFPDFSFDILESEQLVSIIKTNLKEYNAPDNLILRGELENIFFSLISKLPEELKVTIKLREVDELTYEEIALIMECPVGTVRSRIFRAREAIEKKITNKKVLH
jgi:RNA polymerase sigma-70 factor (ECF subfamily)